MMNFRMFDINLCMSSNIELLYGIPGVSEEQGIKFIPLDPMM